MDEKLPGIILASILSIFSFTSIYFLKLGKITINSINIINPIEIFKVFTNINFILFLIIISISFALVLLISKIYNYKFASIFIGAGIFIGSIVALLLFNELSLLILLIITIIAIIFSIKDLTKKEEELKYMKTLRSGISVMGKIIIIIAIGFFLQLSIMNLDKKDKYEEEFPQVLVDLTVGNSKSIGDTTKEPLIDLVILTQKQTVNTILNNNAYKKIQDKNDLDVQTFILTMESLNSQINSSEYKKTYEKEFDKRFENIDFGKNVLSNSPLMENLAKNAWLLYAITAALSVLFIGGLIVKNLSAILYAAIITIINKIKKNNLN